MIYKLTETNLFDRIPILVFGDLEFLITDKHLKIIAVKFLRNENCYYICT